jgi:G:T-mismatch repair DNA endonuclease (very short patch repair protein)
MADRLTAEQCCFNMSRVPLHSMGFRFRLHRRDLPGGQDIVLPRWRMVVFVHGCF